MVSIPNHKAIKLVHFLETCQATGEDMQEILLDLKRGLELSPVERGSYEDWISSIDRNYLGLGSK